ncbi:MAG: hypothetical protein EP330_20410 [Deltaproteobacteria bacterium]|nr:MAG: hypothetical protein EP330_20410 [Deltaproteobacteria bacterium]
MRLLPFLLAACAPTVREAPLDTATGDSAMEETDSPVDTGDTAEPVTRPEARLDAVLAWPGDRTYFFAGTEYMRFDAANGEVDAGYPLDLATYWDGAPAELDAAALVDEDTVLFFRGAEVVDYDRVADAARGPAEPLTQRFPELWADGIDAAAVVDGVLWAFRDQAVRTVDLASGDTEEQPLSAVVGAPETGVDAAFAEGRRLHLFAGEHFATVDLDARQSVDGGRFVFAWPGLWDPEDGTGDVGDRLPTEVAAMLVDDPTPEEVAARKARVRQSIVGTDYVDLSASYPQYTHSVEERLGAWGCLILYDAGRDVHRFRCATDTAGAGRLEMAPLTVPFVDWRAAAYHVDQTSQGDFSADAGAPLSIFDADGDVFYIERVSANGATGSISGGLNIRVRYDKDGVEHQIGFSHLNTNVPGYVLDAAADGTPLPTGTVFGFIGYTGNLWIGAPPEVDGPYTGSGAGLPVSHSHLWFANDLDNHTTLTRETREAIDFSGRYPYGGG